MGEDLRTSDPRTVGPWQILRRIGAGGMGMVYYASRDGEYVALKVVGHVDGPDSSIGKYFKRELANLRLVSGPYVASLRDADIESVPAWIASEYIDGPNFKVFVDSNGPLLGKAWGEFAAALLEGISQVHARGVVHRDLKPTNIVMSVNGPKLIDFGIAQALDDTPFTKTGLTAGTPTWMAPEQANSTVIGQPTDLFAAGSVLLYAATGREPWGLGTVAEIQARIIHMKPDLGGLSASQRRIVSALLRKEPGRRPTAEAALKLLAGSKDWAALWRKVFFACAGVLPVVGLFYWLVVGTVPIPPEPVNTPVVPTRTVAAETSVAASPIASTAEPTALPDVSPPLIDVVPVAIVQADRLNVRASAAPDAEVVFVAERNDTLYVTGEPTAGEPEWLPVYGVGKGYGWVAERLVVLEERPATGLDYDVWLENVHSRPPTGGKPVAEGANVISSTNAAKLHQSGLLYVASPTMINISPDGATLAAASGDGTIKLVAVPSGNEIHTFAGHTSLVSSVAFSPDGKTLASGSLDKAIKLWDVVNRVERVSLLGHTSAVLDIAFSPDGRVLASAPFTTSADRSDRVRLWDVKTGKALGIVDAPAVNSVYFSPDGETLATGGVGANVLQIWNVTTGFVSRTIDFSLGVWRVALSPDGKLLAVAAFDETVRLVDVTSGQMLRTLSGHTDRLQAVAFSPDGATVASASADTTIKLWEVSTGRELRTLNGHTDEVFGVIFSPDGKMLASGSKDGTIRLWDDSEVLPVFELKKLEEKPIRWDPCAGPIRVAVNFGAVTPVQRKQIEVIMVRSTATLNRHSGLEFVYSGPTLRHAAGDYREGRKGNEAIILDFVSSSQMSNIVLDNISTSINPDISSREWWSLAAADIKVDAELEWLYWSDHGWGDSLVLRRLLEVSGLQGVNSQYEVMSIPNNISERFRANEFYHMNLELGPGDILGLQAVGAEQGCIVK